MSGAIASPKVIKGVGRPVGSNREDSLARILPAARKLFAKRGYAKTTFKEIGRAVGLTPAALYAYFPSKAELYKAACDHAQTILLDDYILAMEEGGTLREQLSKMFKAGALAHDQDSSITGLLGTIALEVSRHPELAELMLEQQNATFELVTAAFADAQQRGEINDTASPETQAMAVMGAATGVALFQYGLKRSDLAESMEVFIELLEARLFNHS